MDDNVMTVLKMLQEGKISSQEAEKLISALRGDGRGATPPPPPDPPQPEPPHEAGKRFGGFDKIKPPKLDFDDLGSKISSAIAKVQPDKIVRRVQSQLHDAVRAGARWGNSFPNRVWHWAEGADQRPEKPETWHDRTDDQEHTFHLEANASLTIENPIGNVQIHGTTGETATVKIHKQVWSAFPEDLEKTYNAVEIATHATDTRLDIKVNVPDHFFEGVVDIVMEVPAEVTVRVSTRYGNIEVQEIGGRVEGVTSAGKLSFENLKGDARGETASGDAHLEHIAGMVSIATQSGDIHAEHIHKGITANAVSGDVRIEHIEGGAVECKSVSGDAHAEHIGNIAPLEITVESVSGDCHLAHAIGNIRLKAVSGDVQAEHLSATNLQAQTVSGCIQLNLDTPFSGMMQLNTVSGDVETTLPEGSNVRITLGTNSGELSCDHPVTEKTSSTTFWTGIVGTGAGTLNVQTISGDVHIGKA